MPVWDWGFEPEDISQHVDLFYGDADDLLDREMSQQLGARLPDCTTHVWRGVATTGSSTASAGSTSSPRSPETSRRPVLRG
jgi:hypothetical protein